MRRSREPGGHSGRPVVDRAAEAHELSIHAPHREGQHARRSGRSPEPHGGPAHRDPAARGDDDDGEMPRESAARPGSGRRIEATGEATGELLGTAIHGAAGLQGVAELSRLFALTAAVRTLLEVREEPSRVHELQLVVVIGLVRRLAVRQSIIPSPLIL